MFSIAILLGLKLKYFVIVSTMHHHQIRICVLVWLTWTWPVVHSNEIITQFDLRSLDSFDGVRDCAEDKDKAPLTEQDCSRDSFMAAEPLFVPQERFGGFGQTMWRAHARPKWRSTAWFRHGARRAGGFGQTMWRAHARPKWRSTARRQRETTKSWSTCR